MGCCSMTQRHSGIDEVGPDEIELMELSGDNLGLWNLGETRLQLSVRIGRDEPPSRHPSVRHLEQEWVLWGRSRDELHHRIYSQQPIRDWEGQPAHMYGEIVCSSLVSLYNTHTQETSERFLVLFSFHLLILSLDHSRYDFNYEGILPLSGLSFHALSLDHAAPHASHMFQISGPMVDPKVFICSSAAELRIWAEHLEKRRHKAMTQPLSPSHCALSYLSLTTPRLGGRNLQESRPLVNRRRFPPLYSNCIQPNPRKVKEILPCDEPWKRDELKNYLLQAPIWQWEGSPIQHMGQPGYLSLVHIINTQRQGLQERLMVLFPQDVLLLCVDSKRLNIRYEGRLPRRSIRAVERSALPGRLEFELTGDLMETLQVSCACSEDYKNWIFQLQQPEKNSQTSTSPHGPPIMPKKQRRRNESQEAMILPDQCQTNRWS